MFMKLHLHGVRAAVVTSVTNYLLIYFYFNATKQYSTGNVHLWPRERLGCTELCHIPTFKFSLIHLDWRKISAKTRLFAINCLPVVGALA